MIEHKLKISKETQIYVCCPANIATGGPELLHQLVYELNKLGLNACMFYFNKVEKNPIHENYVKYNNSFTNDIEDNKNNIIIVPEAYTSIIYDYKNVQKVLWWLSVDNFYRAFYSKSKIKKLLKPILFKLNILKIYKFEKNNNILHFVQSEYAKQHLISKGVKGIYFLGDYLNELFIRDQLNHIESEKKDIVIYNPKKGIEFTKKIINFNKNIKYLPIENMTRDEVASLLSTAKVYIDFGNHPGKDRIPREASISGCCILTNKQGSAKYYEDVPISDEFKFDDNDNNIPNIVEKINDCIVNYEINTVKFSEHRSMIQNEQNHFIEDIKHIFTT